MFIMHTIQKNNGRIILDVVTAVLLYIYVFQSLNSHQAGNNGFQGYF